MRFIFFALIPLLCFAQSGTFFLMGTYARIELPEGYDVYKVYKYMRYLEERLSDYIDSSDISRINAYAGVKPVSVSEDTLEVLGISKYVYYKTYGFFDITVGAYTINFKRNKLINTTTAKRLINLNNLVIRGGQVFLKEMYMAIDLGGIGKGYAVEKAYEYVNSPWGFIGIAGDMKVWGIRKALAVKDPREGSLVQMVNKKDLCLSTSGNYYREHIEVSDKNLLQITVATENCSLADAYATALFSMPQGLRRRFLEENPNVGVLELYRDGSVYMNSAFFDFFEGIVFKGGVYFK